MSLVGRVLRGAGLQSSIGGDQVVEQLFEGMLEGGSGKHISVQKSLTLPAVFKAIRLFSEVAGALPLIAYRRSQDGEGRDRATEHPSYSLLHDKPNPGQDAVTFWTLLFNHFASWGAMFIGKEFRGGSLKALHALEPPRVVVERRANGELIFKEQLRTGGVREWTQRELIYVPLFTVDGFTPLSPIGLARETLQLAVAMRKHGVNTFDEAAIPGGALETEQEIKDVDVRDRMRKEWKQRHEGKRDIAILDAGAKFHAITMPFEDAQFVELHGATRADVADFFNMPASVLNGTTGDSLTYGNRESDMQQLITFTLQNPLRKVEQAISNDRDLFPQVNTFFSEFYRDALLQPDSRARATYYRLALDPKSGWMDRGEVRTRENLPKEARSPVQPIDNPDPPEEPAE